jgi:PAS domain S-box-containing protein
MRESQGQSFGALVEGLPVAVYRRSAEPPWRLEYVSDAIESIIGYRARVFLVTGAAADAIVPAPEDLPLVTAAIGAAVSTGQPFEIDYRVRHADGSKRWVVDRGQPGRDGGGSPTWIDGALLDITDHKHAELELIQQRALLRALMDNTPDPRIPARFRSRSASASAGGPTIRPRTNSSPPPTPPFAEPKARDATAWRLRAARKHPPGGRSDGRTRAWDGGTGCEFRRCPPRRRRQVA